MGGVAERGRWGRGAAGASGADTKRGHFHGGCAGPQHAHRPTCRCSCLLGCPGVGNHHLFGWRPQDDKDLQGWLASNEFAGLGLLPSSGSVPVDEKLVRRVRNLVSGQRYLAMPSRGGIKSMRETVSKVEGYTKNQVRKSEGELEEAVVKYAPELLGWPFGVAIAVRSAVDRGVRKPALSGQLPQPTQLLGTDLPAAARLPHTDTARRNQVTGV